MSNGTHGVVAWGKRGYRALLLLTDWASYLVLGMMGVVVTVDVFCRYFLGFSTEVAEDVASFGLVSLIFVALPGAFEESAFLRVDALYNLLRGPLRRALDLLFHVLAVAVTLVYVVFVGKLVANSFMTGVRSDSLLGTPNYLPQCVMLFGLAVLVVSLLAGLLRCLRKNDRAQAYDA